MNTHNLEWTEENVARLWDYYSKNLKSREYFSCHSGKYILNFVKRFIKFKDKEILDFGCGPGYLIEQLLKLNCKKVFGLDFSDESIESVNSKFSNSNRFAKAVGVKVLPSELAADSIDLVMGVEVFEHLNDEQLASTIKEIYRVMRQGAHVVITTPNEENLEADKVFCPECACVFHRWQHIRKWDKASLEHKMREFGFKTVKVSTTVFGTLAKRLFHIYKRAKNKDLINPHLIYIGRK
jgi:2-polyprenyl-3-methyl-5-hydroxy-6-metoxy-1,4-benzoquinol methylase